MFCLFWLCFGSICWFHSFPHLGFHPGVYLWGFLGPYGSRISTLRCQVLPAKWKSLQQGPFLLGKVRFRGQQSIFVSSTCPQCSLRRVWDVNFVAGNPWQIARKFFEDVHSKTYKVHLRICHHPAPSFHFASFLILLSSGVGSQSRRIVWAVCTKKGPFQSATREKNTEKPWRKCLVFQQWPGAVPHGSIERLVHRFCSNRGNKTPGTQVLQRFWEFSQIKLSIKVASPLYIHHYTKPFANHCFEIVGKTSQ